MKKLFRKQLDTNQPLTEETIKNYEGKSYFNGERMKIGDKVLFGLLMGEPEIDESQPTRLMGVQIESKPTSVLPMELVALKKSHFKFFEKYPTQSVDGFPNIKKRV